MSIHAHSLIITGGSFTNHRGGEINVLEQLKEAAAPNALYNAKERYDPPRCHPHTRSRILDHLDGRTGSTISPEITITWLYGHAGSGKSAILQTLSERWAKLGRLLATFFLWKSDSTRNKSDHFVATICYQIIQILHPVKHIIAYAIKNDPLIFTKDLKTQIQLLIVEPLQQLFLTGFFDQHSPYVIVVDGLDECVEVADRRVLLHCIAHLTKTCKAPITFLISSRPEVDINHVFNTQPMQGLWLSCTLHRDYQSDEDIRLFLSDSFRDINLTHPYNHRIPSGWPSYNDITDLVSQASGQFIFASVVVKYVSAHNALPHRSLEVVMGLRPASHGLPFAELDAMYYHLLESHPSITKVLPVLRCVLAGIRSMSIIGTLLGFDTEDVELTIGPLAAIVTFIHDIPGNKYGLRIEHASFTDFLSDKSRSGCLCIGSLEECKLRAARLCVDRLKSHQACHDGIFCVFMDMLLRDQHCSAVPWFQIAIELHMGDVWPLNDAGHFYQYLRYIPNKNTLLRFVWDSWVKQIMPQLRMRFKQYLSSLKLTAALVLSITMPFDSKSHILIFLLKLAKSQRHFDQRALNVTSMGHLTPYCPSLPIMKKMFNDPAPNRVSLLRRHIDIAVMAILSSFVRFRFSLNMLHINPPGHCHQSRYYGGRTSKIQLRQWRSRRVYRNAGIKLYRYKIPQDHPCTVIFCNFLPRVLRHCSTSTTMISFVQSYVKYIPSDHFAQHTLKGIRQYLSCRKDGRMPDDEVEFDDICPKLKDYI